MASRTGVESGESATPGRVPWLVRVYARLMHAAPLAGGLTRLSFNAPLNRLLGGVRGPVAAIMRNGVRIDVDVNDYHGRVLYLFGTNDPKVQHTATTLLRPGDVFLDIGANYSSIGLHAAETVGPGGAVHLFEPQPRLCACVGAAIDAAGLSHVTLHPIGLLDRDGELELAAPSHHTGMATFRRDDRAAAWERQTVAVRAVGPYLEPLVAGRPFGAKVDVEGVETVILPWLLAQPTLRFVVFEAAHDREDLLRIVHDHGYTLFGLERRVFAKSLGLVGTLEALRRYHDVVAVRWPGDAPPPRIRPAALAERMS